jgi:hypothetical protein
MGGMTTGFTLAVMLNNAVEHGTMQKNILKKEIWEEKAARLIRLQL